MEAVDDDVDEGQHHHHIHHLATGAGLGAVSLSVTITDNDTPGAELPLAAGLSLVGWFGLPTTARAIIDGNPDIETIWIWNQADGWRVDSRALPTALRADIAIVRGDAFWLRASADTQLAVPLP